MNSMDTLLQLMEVYGYAAMFVAMVAENANIPVPSEVVLGFAGFLISQHIFDFWTTFIIACAAGVTGSILSYWLGSSMKKSSIWPKRCSISTVVLPSSSAAACPAYGHSFPFRPASPVIPSAGSYCLRLSAPFPGHCCSSGPAPYWAVIGVT